LRQSTECGQFRLVRTLDGINLSLRTADKHRCRFASGNVRGNGDRACRAAASAHDVRLALIAGSRSNTSCGIWRPTKQRRQRSDVAMEVVPTSTGCPRFSNPGCLENGPGIIALGEENQLGFIVADLNRLMGGMTTTPTVDCGTRKRSVSAVPVMPDSFEYSRKKFWKGSRRRLILCPDPSPPPWASRLGASRRTSDGLHGAAGGIRPR